MMKSMLMNLSKLLIILISRIPFIAGGAAWEQTSSAQNSNFFGKDVTLSAPYLSKPVHSSNSEAPELGATVPMKDFPTESKDDNIVLNSKCFCNEPDIKVAW